MPRSLFLAALLLALAPATLSHAQPAPATQPAATQPDVDPFVGFNRHWCSDPRWNTNKEVAKYLVTAKGKDSDEWIDTSIEAVDPRSKNRAVNPLRENTRQVIQQVTYSIAGPSRSIAQQTLVFVGATDFKSLRVDTTFIDSTGTTFKQFINHKGTLEWHQFSVLPDEGHKTGTFSPNKKFVYENALPALLRAYPFDGDHAPIEIELMPDQASANLTPTKPVPAKITYVAKESVDLAQSEKDDERKERRRVQTHHLAIIPDGDESQTLHYWFYDEGRGKWDWLFIKSECHGVRRLLRDVNYIEKDASSATK